MGYNGITPINGLINGKCVVISPYLELVFRGPPVGGFCFTQDSFWLIPSKSIVTYGKNKRLFIGYVYGIILPTYISLILGDYNKPLYYIIYIINKDS